MDQAANLRSIIKKKNPPKFAKVITVTSGKGGVGKSNTSINLAIQLSKQKKKVIIIDADFALANVEILLGIRPKYNLADFLYHGKGIQDIITYGPEGIGFISGGSGVFELVNLKKDQVTHLVQGLYELDRIADIIIIDTGAGINDNVTEFIMVSSDVFIIVTPEPTSITDSYALLKSISKNPAFSRDNMSLKIIANNVRNEKEGMEIYQKLRIVSQKFLNMELDFLGSIPYDESVRKAVIKQTPYSLAYTNSAASRAVKSISEKIGMIDKKDKKKRGITHIIYDYLKNKFE